MEEGEGPGVFVDGVINILAHDRPCRILGIAEEPQKIRTNVLPYHPE